jgi:hypothetical protein
MLDRSPFLNWIIVADLMLEFFILKDVWSVDRYYAWMCAVEGKQVVATVLLECGYYDVEQVEWLTQRLLVILGTACVEKTAGDLFSQPAAVVPDVKKEMLEYLNSQSEAYASGSGVVSSQGVNQVRISLRLGLSFSV